MLFQQAVFTYLHSWTLRRMQARHASIPNDDDKTQKGSNASPMELSGAQRTRHRHQELQVHLPLYQHYEGHEPEQPRLLSYASKQNDKKPRSPRVVRPKSARHLVYRQHSDKPSRRLSKGGLQVQWSHAPCYNYLQKPPKKYKAKYTTRQGEISHTSSPTDAHSRCGLDHFQARAFENHACVGKLLLQKGNGACSHRQWMRYKPSGSPGRHSNNPKQFVSGCNNLFGSMRGCQYQCACLEAQSLCDMHAYIFWYACIYFFT